jgi:MtrB/PioB family decaheme-associated outer membrane protein
MSVSKFPLKSALLVAALAQALASPAYAAKAAKDADEEEGAPVCEDCPDYSGRTAWVEGGIGVQSEDSTHFGRYNGHQDSGATVNLNGEVRYRGKLDGAYLDGKFVDLGLDTRNLGLAAGHQGKYGVEVEYDQVPNYRAQYPGTTLHTERDRLGAKFSYLPSKNWEITGNYRHETKDGTRDVGAVMGFGTPMILPVTFNYKTDDFGLAVGYNSKKLQARLAYDGSLFDGGQTGITWNNPVPPPATGRIAEAPDNQFHKVSAQVGYQLAEHTRVGATYALGQMTQDQSFLPYSTSVAGPGGNLNGKVNTTLAKVDLNSRPTTRLRLDASYSYSDRDNTTPVNTYNYVITDAALSTAARQNRPYSFTQRLMRLKAGYRISNGVDLSAGFDDDRMLRTYQQVERTDDQTVWAKLKLQPVEGLDTTIKISHANRDASAYDPATNMNPLFPDSGATVGDPLLKVFEMADRRRDKIGFDIGYSARENLSLGLSVDYNKDNYKYTVLGLNKATGYTLSPNLTYTFSEDLSGAAYYTYDRQKSWQSGREWIVAPPISSLWAEADTNLTHTVGLNFTWKVIPEKLDVGTDVVYSTFTGKMQYGNGADLPDLTSTMSALGVHGTYKLKENMMLRAEYRYEKYRSYDWANVTVSTVQSLGVTPTTQETNLVYVSVRYDFK